VVVADVSNWWLILQASGLGVVGAGEGLSAGGDVKVTPRTQVSRWTDSLYTCENKK
jgi:hypothetical protein